MGDFESESQLKELFVCNIPFVANAQNVIDTIETYIRVRGRNGKVHRCELKPDRNNNPLRNRGHGFISLRPEDADELLGYARHLPPVCLARQLIINNAKGNRQQARIDHPPENEFTFQVENFEMGNWAGQPRREEERRKKKKRRGGHRTTERWSFIKDWEYPDYYTELRLTVSKNKFFLDGFGERRVEIPFRLLDGKKGVLFDPQGDDTLSVYLSIKHPPTLYQKTNDSVSQGPLSRFLFVSIMGEEFRRTIDWTGTMNAFGKCLVYRLVFRDNIEEIKKCLKERSAVLYGKVDSKEASETSSTYLSETFNLLPFSLRFKVECLISHGIITQNEICDRRLGDQLINLAHEGKETIAWYALDQISTKHWDPSDDYYNQRPIDIFDIAVRNFRGKYKEWHPANPNILMESNNRCAWVNHATITPTKIYFDGPTYEPSNRILRQYHPHIDRFMRVTFSDENFDRLFVSIQDGDICKNRIEFIMINGFQVAGRHYEFLAFSSSQLRETSCWFVSADGDFNPNRIRSLMGDFSTIRAPALYAARMGQCFSSTVSTIELDRNQVMEIPDVEWNDYVFSDGCGTISESLAKRVTKLYWGSQWKRDKEVPSVFQIRFGGVKGVVSVDRNLQGDVLCIRPSQTKFEAPVSRNLEICKTVRNPLVGHLNRQIIMILESLGVSHEVFMALQDGMREDIDLMNEDEDKAREIVNRSVGSRECSHITRTILSMIDEGMMRTNEPFLKGLLECKRIFALKTLRYKARILMPKSFLIFGILDETGILEPGQIFVQTSIVISKNQTFSTMNEKVKRRHQVHLGKAVITRNPCLHPGDIQMVTAVDVPELSHLRNCIVFSQKGERPLPNCLSGGDLDGDEYFVCFDERIFFDSDEEAMNYDPPERKKLDRPVEISDICEFYTDFMINNRLGQIANLHLAFADYEAEGVRCKECKQLAQDHSMAVDFNKTGVPVTGSLPKIPQYPDFMENKSKNSYPSEKVLGKLYRRIKLDKPDDDPLLNYKASDGIESMEEFRADGFEDHVEEAVIYKNAYNSEIRSLMKKYNVKTEPEIVTSNLLGYRRIDGRKGQDIREAISGAISKLICNSRKNFLMELRRNDDTEVPDDEEDHFGYHIHIPINEETKAKASAWYMVTYDEENYDTYDDEEDLDPDEKRLLSFPWVVADILLAIRVENRQRDR